MSHAMKVVNHVSVQQRLQNAPAVSLDIIWSIRLVFWDAPITVSPVMHQTIALNVSPATLYICQEIQSFALNVQLTAEHVHPHCRMSVWHVELDSTFLTTPVSNVQTTVTHAQKAYARPVLKDIS